MPILKPLSFLLLAVLATVTAQAQSPPCPGYSPGPSISSSGSALADGQGSSYLLVQVCGLQPGVSVVTQVVLLDFNYNTLLFTGQAPTDVNGVAHINITDAPVGQSNGNYTLLFSSPDLPGITYSTADCPKCSPAVSLAGQFVFQFQGTTAADSQPFQMVGAFLANGKGLITGGEVDLNSAGGVFEKVPLTGTYTYNATAATAVLTLVTPLGSQIFQATLNIGNEGGLISSSGLLLGTGQLTPTLFSSEPYYQYRSYGSYVTEVSGSLPCDLACGLLGGASSVKATGLFCLACQPAPQPDSEPVYSGLFDENSGLQSTLGMTQQGQAGPPDSFYRFVLTSSTPGSTDVPTRYAVYPVDYFDMYLISLDPPDQRAAVSGTATQVYP
jgi:hypothetical protein